MNDTELHLTGMDRHLAGRINKIKLLRQLDEPGARPFSVAAAALRMTTSRLAELEDGAVFRDRERHRVNRLVANIKYGVGLNGYKWRVKSANRTDLYTIDGKPCEESDYFAMADFQRRCWECGEVYNWQAWEKLPIFATGKLLTEETTSDVKQCPCGSEKWTAPAYRRA